MASTTVITTQLFSQSAESTEVDSQSTAENDSSSPGLSEAKEGEAVNIKLSEESDLNIIYKGEHHLNLNVGLTVPVVMHFYNNLNLGNNGWVLAPDHYDPAVGLTGSFMYRYFFDKGFFLGGELGGTYIQTSQNSQTLITLAADAGYMIRRWPVDIPISLSIGGHFNSLQQEYPAQDLQTGGIFIKPSIGVLYNIDETWALGATTSWNIYPEIYVTDELKNDSVFANFWSFAITVRYRFNE